MTTNMIYTLLFVFFAFVIGSEARCYGYKNCKCIRSRIACHGVTDIPDFSLDFVQHVEFFDMRRSRLSKLSQLKKVEKWQNLKVVDVRDQTSDFECDSFTTRFFEIKSDCDKNMYTTTDNGYFLVENGTSQGYDFVNEIETTSESVTTDFDSETSAYTSTASSTMKKKDQFMRTTTVYKRLPTKKRLHFFRKNATTLKMTEKAQK